MSADLSAPSPFAGIAWEPGVGKPDPILVADDIREGEHLYRQRVPEQVRENTSFLKEAFEELIAKMRA